MKHLAWLVALSACHHGASAATLRYAPAQRSGSYGEIARLDAFQHVLRHRLAAAHVPIDQLGVVIRGDQLVVEAPPDQAAAIAQLVERPYDVHFAVGSEQIALAGDTVKSVDLSFDPQTKVPQLAIAIDPATARALNALGQRGPAELVVDGEIMSSGIQLVFSDSGRATFAPGGSDVEKQQAVCEEVRVDLLATLAVPVVPVR